MFPLFHERTRRLICRVAFLLFGLLPTAAVVAWSASFNNMYSAVEVRERLEIETGLKVTFDAVQFTRPGGMLLENFALADPETGAPLVRARLLEMTTYENQKHLRASQPIVEAVALGKVWPLVEKSLRRPPNSKQPVLVFEAGELTLNWSGGAETLVGCRLDIESSAEGQTALGSCKIAHTATPQTVGIQIDRRVTSGKPTTSFRLDTSEAPLHCALLASLFGYENSLGPESTFTGSIQGLEGHAGWRVACKGNLAAIDLQAVVSDFPQQLRGPAEITSLETEFRAGRLETATGRLTAGPGFIGHGLLDAASACLGLRCNPTELRNAPEIATYEKLSADFEIGPKGFTLNGKCGDPGSGEIIRTKTGVLVQDSTRGPVPVVALVKMLVPDSQYQVPATRQTDWLLRLLPLPIVLPRDPNAMPQAKIGEGRSLQ